MGSVWEPSREKVGTDSFGNGAAMRVAPIGCFYYKDRNILREKAALSARVTDKHPEGIPVAAAQAKGANYGYEQIPKA